LLNEHPYKILKNPQQTNFNVIELFAGCGGMALGFENAGLQTKLLLEIDKNCCATLAKNRPYWNIINQDVTQLNFSEYYNQVNIVAGGFLYRYFSHARERKGFLDTMESTVEELSVEGGKIGFPKGLSYNEPSLTVTCSPAQIQTN
jgi:DNA (cytosine-5)-methyltransferase 1